MQGNTLMPLSVATINRTEEPDIDNPCQNGMYNRYKDFLSKIFI